MTHDSISKGMLSKRHMYNTCIHTIPFSRLTNIYQLSSDKPNIRTTMTNTRTQHRTCRDYVCIYIYIYIVVYVYTYIMYIYIYIYIHILLIHIWTPRPAARSRRRSARLGPHRLPDGVRTNICFCRSAIFVYPPHNFAISIVSFKQTNKIVVHCGTSAKEMFVLTPFGSCQGPSKALRALAGGRL